MSGYKLTILAASLAALIPIGLQWQANRLNAASAPSVAPMADAAALPQAKERVSEVVLNADPRTSDELLAQMRALSESGKFFRVYTSLRHLMFGLRHDEMEAALDALLLFVNSPKETKISSEVAKALFSRWASLDPGEASRHATEIHRDHLRRGALDGLVQSWVKTDRESVESFIENQPDGPERTTIEAHYWRYFTKDDPIAAADRALAVAEGNEQTELLNRLFMYWWKEPSSAIEWLEEKVDDSPTRDGWLNRMIDSLARQQPSVAFEKSMGSLTGTQQKSTVRRVIEHWVNSDPEPALAAVLDLPETVRDGHIIEALGKGLSDFSAIDRMLEQLPDESERTAFVNGLATGLPDARHEMRNVTPENVDKIRQLVEELPPGEDRFSARWNLAAAWAGLDYEQARAWYHSQPGVDERMKEKFVKLNTQ